MKQSNVTRSTLAGIIAVGVACLGTDVAAAGNPPPATIKPDPVPARMTVEIIRNRTNLYTKGWVKCYGINAADKNTCNTATVNCGNNAPRNDPDAFVAVPKGLCTRIAGGSLTPRITVEAAKNAGMPLAGQDGEP